MQSGLKNTTISNKKAKLSFKKKKKIYIYIYIYIFIYLRNQVEFLKIETKSEFIPYYFLVKKYHILKTFFFSFENTKYFYHTHGKRKEDFFKNNGTHIFHIDMNLARSIN